MRHAIGIAAAVALLAQQGSASAEPRQDLAFANFVMSGCREFMKPQSTDLAYRQGICGGIVRAMFYYSRSRLELCTPEGANVEEAVRVVIAYVDQRPTRMHERFEDLALEALQEAWPCRRQ